MAVSVLCPSCGYHQTLEAPPARRKVRCPECGVMCEVEEATASAPRKPGPSDDEEAVRLLAELDEPPAPPPPRPPMPPRASASPAPRPGAVSTDEDDDDGQPYVVEGGEERLCPKCRKVIEDEAVLCVHCGLDFRKGKKVRRTYEPLQRTWDLGLSQQRRWQLLTLFSLAGLALFVASNLILQAPWYTALGPWLGLTVLLAYLLGTFFRAELTRDRRGRARLMRSWRICFYPLAPQQVDLLQYEGVRIDMTRNAGFLEWILCIDLLLYGVIPGILWWYHIIHKDRWNVVLTRDHGQAHEVLYRGTDAVLAQEVAAALRDAARLSQETL